MTAQPENPFSPDDLDRLISRVLDGEASTAERHTLSDRMAHDPRARAEYETYCALDRQVGAALRTEMHRRPRRTARIFRLLPALESPGAADSRGQRLGRAALLAVAAAVALFMVFPRWQPVPSNPAGPRQAGVLPRSGDIVVSEVPSAYERPEFRLRGSQRDWIVMPVPTDRQNTIVILEVDQVRTHVIGVHQDY